MGKIKKNWTIILLTCFTIISIISISIGYSSLNTNLTLSGDAYVRVDADIRITDLKMIEATNNAYETYNSKFSKDTTSTFINLPKVDSSITYEITVTNNSDNQYYLKDIIEQNNTNNKITYNISEITIGDIIKPHSSQSFTIKFATNDMNQTSSIILNYIFEKIEQTVFTFDYTGNPQIFTVPYNGTYKIELWGAQGGSVDDEYIGGKGAYISGNITLDKNETFYIYIGGAGIDEKGGYNGGGNGNFYNLNLAIPNEHKIWNYAGGGATDIRLISGSWNDFSSLNSRIMVASGGSGASSLYNILVNYLSDRHPGTPGGGILGYTEAVQVACSGGSYSLAQGGTQISGGIGGIGSQNLGISGGFGFGGASPARAGSAAGSGYYGGGSGGSAPCVLGIGGSGSSFISGHAGSVAITSENNQTPKSGCTTGTTNQACSIHYSNYQFTNTIMINGGGYQWTNTKGNYIGQPIPNNSGNQNGQGGNGYAKVTLIQEN